jgi:uncharacterized coiled-coil protein SlyX
MLPTLYEIANEYRADVEKLADLDLPPEVVADTLEGLSGALEAKAKNIGALVKHLDMTIEAMKDAEAQVYKKRKALEARVKAIQDYTLNVLVANDISKIETPFFNLTVAKNPPAVEVYDQSQVPAHFYRQPEPPPPVLDKSSIKEALKYGEDVPGCRLTQSLSLRIK